MLEEHEMQAYKDIVTYFRCFNRYDKVDLETMIKDWYAEKVESGSMTTLNLGVLMTMGIHKTLYPDGTFDFKFSQPDGHLLKEVLDICDRLAKQGGVLALDYTVGIVKSNSSEPMKIGIARLVTYLVR